MPISPSNLEPVVFVLDVPVLDADTDPNPQDQQVNLYWAPTLRIPARNWPGCRLYYFRSAGDIREISISRPLGAPSAVIQNAVGDMQHWHVDRNTQIILRYPYREASFVSAASWQQLVNGANLGAIIKKNTLGAYTGEVELVQFMSARRVNNEIVLFDLLRGRHGTDTMAKGHVAGEDFVLLEDGSDTPSFRLQQDQADGSTVIRYYTTNLGVNVADVAGFPLKLAQVLIGRSLFPFAPVRVRAKRLANGTIEISWIRRGRYNSDLQRGYIPYTERDKDGRLFLGYRVQIDQVGANAVDFDSETPNSPFTFDLPMLNAADVEDRQIVDTGLVDSRGRMIKASGKVIFTPPATPVDLTGLQVGSTLSIRVTQLNYHRDSGFGNFQSVKVE